MSFDFLSKICIAYSTTNQGLIASCPPLTELLDVTEADNGEEELLFSLGLLASQAWAREDHDQVLCLGALIKILVRKSRVFRGNRQEDVHEALGILLR